MKKISKGKILTAVIFVAVVLLILFFSPKRYEGWKTVSLPGGSTFKVPEDWVVTWKEDPGWYVEQGHNIIYITDKPMDEDGYKIYLAGTVYCGDMGNYFLPEKLFENVECLYAEDLPGEVYSNSAHYRLERYNISGNTETRYVINFYNSYDNESNFIAWDNLLDKDMIVKIAKSYVTYNDNNNNK